MKQPIRNLLLEEEPIADYPSLARELHSTKSGITPKRVICLSTFEICRI